MGKYAKYFIPTLYFIEGLPYTLTNITSVVVFKSLGVSNEFIGLSSFLALPWMLKFMWAPLVDAVANKKKWVVATQFVAALILAVLSLTLSRTTMAAATPTTTRATTLAITAPATSTGATTGAIITGTVTGTVIAALVFELVLFAIVSATQDVAIDGYYLEILDVRQQAFYVGIRNAFYRLSMLFAGGVMVYAAGRMFGALGVPAAWGCAFAIAAAIIFAAAIFHALILPQDRTAPTVATAITPTATTSTATKPAAEPTELIVTTGSGTRAPATHRFSAFFPAFLPVLRDYLDQPRITAIVIYILTFRLGDALLLKMAQPFLLDARSLGGLGMSMSEVGLIYGTAGTIALLAGGIAGSYLIARDGLPRWLLPFALIQNSAIPLYWYLAVAKPGVAAVAAVNFVEQAAYGLGVTAFTVFILRTVKPGHRAAHYAIATALMSAGMLAPSAVSGFLAARLGYSGLFLLSSFAAIPGIVSIFFLPLTEKPAAA